MMITWMRGTLAHRWPAVVLAGLGLAVTTALVAVILVFAVVSTRSMTERALAGLPVDWQVAVRPGADVAGVTARLRSEPGVTAAIGVGYAPVAGFETKTDGTTQTTGAGMVLGVATGYSSAFPGQIRLLLGRGDGVLLAQQTAANLHVGVGQTVSILRDGQDPVALTVDGIVELPNADAMFQPIGAGKRATAVAPPDNVLLMPEPRWTALFGSRNAQWQVHVRLDHAGLPQTPDAALTLATGRARHFEVGASGDATVGDDLAARLDAVRTDSLFSGLLLLVLGLPGIALSLLLSAAIARAQAEGQRQRAALLALRGASVATIARIVAAEGIATAAIAAVAGTGVAIAVAGLMLKADLRGGPVLAALGTGLVAGLILAAAAVLLPAIGRARDSTVAARRATLPKTARRPLWQRLGADLILLAAGPLLFLRIAGGGYQVVLAPEGVAAASVDPTAFLVPIFIWIGAGLLVLRIASGLITLTGAGLAVALSPLAGRVSAPIASSLLRQRRRIAGNVALAALAVAFATSVATFAATYGQQALVDARLTNGADVTVTGSRAAPAGAFLARIRSQPGAAAAEPMQHRFAYVGNDLQDLYGIDAGSIGRATDIVDAFVADHDAAGTFGRLAATPDGVLLSQETVNDFQLTLGDIVNLRLPANGEPGGKSVPFRFVGVVSEFPTAPRDSFLVANAAYVAAVTGEPQAEVVLVRGGGDPARLAAALRTTLGPGSGQRITDIAEAGRIIGSSLAAVDLHALARIEGVFAALLVAGAACLVPWLGFFERRAQVGTMLAIGASSRQAGTAAIAEAGIIGLGAGVAGWALGEAVALVLVKLLGGAFDPPPEALLQPWWDVGVILAVLVASLATACLTQPRRSDAWK